MNYQHTVVAGELAYDPELRYTSGGKAVCNMKIAINRSWVKDGEKQTFTTWWKITAWEKLAELCNSYLKKGSTVLFEGDAQAGKPFEVNGEWRSDLILTARVAEFGNNRVDGESNDHVDSVPQMSENDIPF